MLQHSASPINIRNSFISLIDNAQDELQTMHHLFFLSLGEEIMLHQQVTVSNEEGNHSPSL